MYKGENGTIRSITDNRVHAIIAKKQKIGVYGCCLHPLSYGAHEQQDVLGYFQQTNDLLLNLLS